MAEAAELAQEILYVPQEGPQQQLTTCPVDEIFFGGARGGGKTFGFILDWSIWSGRFPGGIYKGIIFRRTYDELDEVVAAAKRVLMPIGAQWRKGDRIMVMPNGNELKFRYLNRDDDAERYQGHQYCWIAFDEVTNWATPFAINKLRATLRSAEVPPRALRFLLSGNPGGVGHNWVKARYVDASPPLHVVSETETVETLRGPQDVTRHRMFIPSLYLDNPALADNDPGYLARLKDSGPDWLVKAWVEGDWNIVAGGMFDDVLDMRTPHEWQNPQTGKIHTWGYGSKLAPFHIPSSWRINRSFDWGSARPFSVGWWAESDGSPATGPNGEEIHIPAGSVVRFHSWYGYTGDPNVGLKMLASEVARGILQIEKQLLAGVAYLHQRIYPGPADSAIWSAENGVSIADDMARNGVSWTAADKRPGSRAAGWETMRRLMKAASDAIPDEPGLYAFETDTEFWRMIPVAPRDKKKIEDIDTDWEDHLADETRYRCQEVRRTVKLQRVKGL